VEVKGKGLMQTYWVGSAPGMPRPARCGPAGGAPRARAAPGEGAAAPGGRDGRTHRRGGGGSSSSRPESPSKAAARDRRWEATSRSASPARSAAATCPLVPPPPAGSAIAAASDAADAAAGPAAASAPPPPGVACGPGPAQSRAGALRARSLRCVLLAPLPRDAAAGAPTPPQSPLPSRAPLSAPPRATA
jgi:hypothetical protein